VWWLRPRQDAAELTADLDVFALPCSEPVPFGLVLLAALGCGVPVAATAAGDPLEILEGIPASAVRLVPPRDARALAAAAVELVSQVSSARSRKSRTQLSVPTSPENALADVFASVLSPGRHNTGSNSMTTLSTVAGRISRFVLPVGAPRRQWVSRRVRALRRRWFRLRGMPPGSLAPSYEKWLRRRTPSPADLEAQRQRSDTWALRPLVSVCLAVCNTDPAALTETLESVGAQSYDNWELCLAVDAALEGDSAISSLVEHWRQREPRLRLSSLPAGDHGKGRAVTTNRALGQAQGAYVALLDDRGILAPHSLYMAVKQLQSGEPIDLLYADEDVKLPSGARVRPFLKPAWCPEALLGFDYLGRFLVARRALVESVGGMRPEREGAHDHDLALRLSEVSSGVAHIAEVLYSERASSDLDEIPDEFNGSVQVAEAGGRALRERVVADALERRGIAGHVESVGSRKEVRVRYRLPQPAPHVEILVPTRDRLDLLRPCLESVERHTDYSDFSLTVIDNDSRDPATMEFVRGLGLEVLAAPGPFNYALIMNDAFRTTHHEFILTLNNDTLITDDQWLRGLLELCARPKVGAVGCRLVFSSGEVQHEGIVLGHRVPAANLAFVTPGIAIDSFLRSTRDVSAVTGACCLMRRSAWEAIGGFDECLSVAYNDVDYCLRLHEHGYRVLYTPHVTVIHDEHATRGAWHPPEDEAIFRKRWGLDLAKGLAACDRFFSPRLALGRWGWQLTPEPLQW
jgi:O-antigen biosynthesis protein